MGRRGKEGKLGGVLVVKAMGLCGGPVASAMVRLMRLVLVPRHVDPGENLKQSTAGKIDSGCRWVWESFLCESRELHKCGRRFISAINLASCGFDVAPLQLCRVRVAARRVIKL